MPLSEKTPPQLPDTILCVGDVFLQFYYFLKVFLRRALNRLAGGTTHFLSVRPRCTKKNGRENNKFNIAAQNMFRTAPGACGSSFGCVPFLFFVGVSSLLGVVLGNGRNFFRGRVLRKDLSY